MIRTAYGPVGLRQARDPEVVKPAAGPAEKKDVKVFKNWLGQKGKKEGNKNDLYRTLIKQTMLLAAAKMEVNDIAFGAAAVAIDEKTGLYRSPEEMQERDKLARIKIKSMQDGSAAIPDRMIAGATALKKTGRSQTRHLLAKTSKYPWAWYKYRYWTLQSGIMRVYRSNGPEYAGERHKLYNIREASCKFETKDMMGITEPFLPNYQARVRVLLKERSWGPVFLYSKDVSEVKSWERAIRMSKYLLNAQDREAMAYVIGRVAGSIMAKGWSAMFKYFNELENTRRLIRGLAMRLTKLDLSRAWNKAWVRQLSCRASLCFARLVYLQKSQQDKLRKEQQDWAARFLRDKMERINNQTARSPAMVRLAAINKVQLLFRHFRQDHIFDRSYALGTNVNTRVQQMMKGVSMMAAFSTLSSREVLELTLKGKGLEAFHEDMDIFTSKTSTYSEVNVNLQKMGFAISENFTMLSFSETSGDSSLLQNADWGHFVNLGQISSVVMHSDRSLGKSRTGDRLPPSSCSGVWFTLYGPRVSWGQRLRKMTDPETQKPYMEVVGSPDGNHLGAALAKGEALHWLRLEIGLKSADVPDLRRELPEEGQIEVFGDQGSVRSDFQTFVVLTVLGKRFRSTSGNGSSPQYQGPYMGKFVAEIPIPVGDLGIAALDTTEIGLEVVEQDPLEPEANRTIWAAKMPLWKVFTVEEETPKPEPPPTATALTNLGLGEGALTTLGLVEEVKEQVTSLASTLRGGSKKMVKRMWLMHPAVDLSDILPLKAHLDLEVSAKVAANSLLPRTPISPELQGRGSMVNLFTSHKMAWMDPSGRQGASVASMVELNVKELIFPSDDPSEDARLYRYYVEATCNGVRATTQAMCRPKKSWSYVVPSDSYKIYFKDSSIFVPLPPGSWSEECPKVSVKVLRSLISDMPAMTFADS
ncbi:unnamed protein product [Effrenium voratum]|nr:unnamed protein product [Effrenium voratum]